MTVIIRGDLAVPYTKAFLQAFELKTKEKLGQILKENSVFEEGVDHLTACAGIAFIKSSYPFYYGYKLAEKLCTEAKNDTKSLAGKGTNRLPASCLMFHKVQDSFIIDYNDIIKRELTAADGLLFKAGPYYIYETKSRYSIDEMEDYAKKLNEESLDGVKSGIRQWLSIRLKDKGKADQRKERMRIIFKKENKPIIDKLTSEETRKCLAYDVLAYNKIMYQQTKEG